MVQVARARAGVAGRQSQVCGVDATTPGILFDDRMGLRLSCYSHSEFVVASLHASKGVVRVNAGWCFFMEW